MPSLRLFSVVLLLLSLSVPVQAAAFLNVTDVISLPGQPLVSFDISFVDPARGVYALADRSNEGVDLIDATTHRFLGRVRGFSGSKGHGAGGPNGIVGVGDDQLWAGDGDSTIKIIAIKSRSIVGTVHTGGKFRVDELAYDPADHLVAAANNADRPPFLSLVSIMPAHRISARIPFPQATAGLEQPVWNAATQRFYLAVPELDGVAARGGIAVIDPKTRSLVKMLPVERCDPAGLAVGPGGRLLVGCSDDAVAHGFAAKSLVMDARTGAILARFRQVGGSDEVWFDPGSDRYYLAAVANSGSPVLGVIDAAGDRWLGNVPTRPHAHSVAADPRSGAVFVPMPADPDDSRCRAGCISIYAPADRRSAR